MWYPWMRSDENPADKASRVYEKWRKLAYGAAKVTAAAKEEVAILPVPAGWAVDDVVVLVCGLQDPAALQTALAELAWERGVIVHCVVFNSSGKDLVSDEAWREALVWVRNVRCVGVLCFPPCGAFFAVEEERRSGVAASAVA